MDKRTVLVLLIVMFFIGGFYYLMQIDIVTMPSNHAPLTELVVAGDRNLPPYEYVDENGDYKGFNVDIMRAIALEMGFQITIVPMEWEAAQKALLAGQVDAIQGMRKTEERENLYDFTTRYFDNSSSIFTANNSLIASLDGLINKTVATQRGDTSYQLLKKIRGVTIIFVPDQRRAIELVSRGEVNAAVGNTLAGIYFINSLGLNDQVDIAVTDLNPSTYSIAVRDGDERILSQLNQGLANIKKGGTYEKIYRKWFGRPIDYQRDALLKTLRFLWAGLITIGLGALAMFKWNDTLKKKVNARTGQLLAEMQFNRAILEDIPSGVLYVRSDSGERFMNREGERLFEALSQIGIDSELVEKSMLESEESQYNEQEFEGTGGNLHVEWRHDSVQLEPKKDEGHIIVFSDKTEKRYFEEAFLSQDRLRGIGLLMAEIAHEIRNPLTSIRNYAQLIPEKINNASFVEAFSCDVPKEIDRLNAIITDVLEYSRPGASFNETISPGEVIKEALGLLQLRFERRGIKIVLRGACDDKNLKVRIHHKHLKQVLLNLYLNALEAIEDLTGTIETEIRMLGENEVEIRISDTGRGMSQEDVYRLFEPFYSRKKDGTGLGVFICDRLLKLYGGSIQFDSELGEGTVCRVRLKGGTQDEIQIDGD